MLCVMQASLQMIEKQRPPNQPLFSGQAPFLSPTRPHPRDRVQGIEGLPLEVARHSPAESALSHEGLQASYLSSCAPSFVARWAGALSLVCFVHKLWFIQSRHDPALCCACCAVHAVLCMLCCACCRIMWCIRCSGSTPYHLVRHDMQEKREHCGLVATFLVSGRHTCMHMTCAQHLARLMSTPRYMQQLLWHYGTNSF